MYVMGTATHYCSKSHNAKLVDVSAFTLVHDHPTTVFTVTDKTRHKIILSHYSSEAHEHRIKTFKFIYA